MNVRAYLQNDELCDGHTDLNNLEVSFVPWNSNIAKANAAILR